MKMNNILRTVNSLAAVFLIFAAVFLSAGCGEKKTAFVFVVDFSASVSPVARELAFAAVTMQAKKMKHGDSLLLIPVTGDALTDTSGKTLRLEHNAEPEAYGAEAEAFLKEAETKLKALQSSAQTFQQSDVLGAMRAAQEEIGLLSDSKQKRVVIIVLSDMVHSTREIRFETDPVLASTDAARKYAEKQSPNNSGKWAQAEIYLGLLESTDLAKMPAARREAVREFWLVYFNNGGARRVEFAIDGIGQIQNFIASSAQT